MLEGVRLVECVYVPSVCGYVGVIVALGFVDVCVGEGIGCMWMCVCNCE